MIHHKDIFSCTDLFCQWTKNSCWGQNSYIFGFWPKTISYKHNSVSQCPVYFPEQTRLN